VESRNEHMRLGAMMRADGKRVIENGHDTMVTDGFARGAGRVLLAVMVIHSIWGFSLVKNRSAKGSD